MAQYKTHTLFNLLLALPLFLAALFYLLHPKLYYEATFAGAFLYGTLFMSPDLDIANKIKLFSLRGFFSLPFRLYARVFKHRGLSHHVIFGTLTRVLWLAIAALGILYLVNQALPSRDSVMNLYQMYKPFIWYGLGGLFAADLCHLLLDL